MQIHLSIADDHPMIVSGLQNMLSNYAHITFKGIYMNGAQLLQGLQQDGLPDVLLLDIQLPDKTGDKLAPILLKKYPEIKILVITNLDSIIYLNNMIRSGVHGYILKNIDSEALVKAVETVYNGGEYIDPMLKEKLEQFTLQMKKESYMKPRLTVREKEILQLIVNGDTSEGIAEKLFLSLNTIEHYRKTILLKMDVNNAAALVKKALKLGLVE